MNDQPYKEDIRYEYPLTADSVVVDCGGYAGKFAEEIARRYDCTVHVLEPVFEFWENCVERLKSNPKITVHPFGIDGRAHIVHFRIKGDMTGMFADDGKYEKAVLISPSAVLALAGDVDLLKLNIEGAEFAVLETILDDRIAGRFKNIQVQWHQHVAENDEERRNKIMQRLGETHELTFDFGWAWQNWSLKQ